jgi:uncharacterized protein (TIGR01244 family)
MLLRRLPCLLLLLLLPLLAQAAEHAPHLLRPGLYAGGQPDEAQLRALAAQGVTTVIDLRGADEARGYTEADVVRQLGLRYVALPVTGAQDITPAKAAALQQALDTAQGPVLLHCASGNRVGALLALSAHTRGASDDDALSEGRAAGLGSLEPVVRAQLQDAHP